MTSYYIKAKHQERFTRFAETFAIVACLLGVLACFFAMSYQIGRGAGILDGIEQVQQCEQLGAGYFATVDGVTCLYD